MKTLSLKWMAGCVILLGMATACQTKKSTSSSAEPTAVDTAHNSRNALDWTGTYSGTLPCADCPGIRYSITLRENDTYEVQTQYLERSDSVFTESGKFSWNAQGSQITLADRGEKFQVAENRLIHLDQEGNVITGDLADMYVLTKATDNITGRYWKLIELNGETVEAGSTQEEPYIRANSEENRIEATGGCNGMGGSFELKEPNRIRFSQLIGTMMACDNMEVENGLKRVLETTDSYHVAGDTLQLFRARMAPLAKFVAENK